MWCVCVHVHVCVCVCVCVYLVEDMRRGLSYVKEKGNMLMVDGRVTWGEGEEGWSCNGLKGEREGEGRSETGS